MISGRRIISDKRSFTLTEIIVVILVLGVLVSVALPRLNAVVERMRAQEAVNFLYALNNAGIRGCIEIQPWIAHTTTLKISSISGHPNNLDIEWPKFKNFTVLPSAHTSCIGVSCMGCFYFNMGNMKLYRVNDGIPSSYFIFLARGTYPSQFSGTKTYVGCGNVSECDKYGIPRIIKILDES